MYREECVFVEDRCCKQLAVCAWSSTWTKEGLVEVCSMKHLQW
jgi:ribosomal protein L31